MKHTELHEPAGSGRALASAGAAPDTIDADADRTAVAWLRAENARLRSLLLPTMAQRAWEGLVNGAVGTLLGVAIAMSMSAPW